MAIPEFILRKLIVPGSLKSTSTGFQFSLLNTFAPATITSFSISVGNKSVPLSDVYFSPAEEASFTGEKISKPNPMPASVGISILISVENQPLNGPVKIIVDTKEIGLLEFTLADSLKKPKYSNFLPTWTAAFRKPLHAKVTVMNQAILGQSSPFVLGQFVEHLERCVYDGIWTKDGSSLRGDTLELLKELHIPLIRYPGGNFASGYHWEDGIGPKEQRPSRHDAAWKAEESNLVGTDEFLSLCEELDIEPYLVVNDGSGTPEEAARWVGYCNSPVDTELGHLRASNGHAEPYNVKYWGVGNEVWGPWQIGTTSAREYVNRLKRFTKAMKAADSSIKIIAVGNNPLSDDPNDPSTLWNKEVLENAGNEIDFLSWHIYQPEQDSWKESYDPKTLFASVCAAPLDFETIIARVNNQIQASQTKGRVTQCIDEWNIWLPPGENAKSMHQVTYTMRDSLYIAGIINVLIRNFDKVDIANLAQLVNVLPLIKTNDKTAFATSIYFPFVLAAEMEEFVLQNVIDSPTFESEKLGNNVLAHKDVPYLDVSSTRSDDGSSITLLLVNRHPKNYLDTEIYFSEAQQYTVTSAKEIRSASPVSYNSFSHPGSVRIHKDNLVTKMGNSYQIRLSPASVAFCKFQKG
ncbi:MAG: alpha-N-arabinofuranosidase [Anaerolineaceae bacterium]